MKFTLRWKIPMARDPMQWRSGFALVPLLVHAHELDGMRVNTYVLGAYEWRKYHDTGVMVGNYFSGDVLERRAGDHGIKFLYHDEGGYC